LVAGVPAGIPVAHKFGETGQVGGERQLHDCGIVYYPNSPYILCIMTRGNNFEELPNIIKQISSEVYKHVDGQVRTGQ
jgi:beta-lactamase class A